MTFILKHKYTIALSIILIIGLTLRINLAQDDFLHKWDERYHALVSKNLMTDMLKPTLYSEPLLSYDYKSWNSNHIWLHKQPLPLWIISVSYKMFGVSEFVTRIPSIIFSFLSIIITFLLAQKLFNKKTAILSAFFIAINGLIIEMASGRIATDHYDTLFLCFIEASIYFAYLNAYKKNVLFTAVSGILLAAALLTKWLPGLIVLPIHICFLIHLKINWRTAIKYISISLLTCILFSLPWQIFILNNYPNEARWEYLHNWLHISTELDGQSGNAFYYLDKIRINYSEIIYLPIIYLVLKLIKIRFQDYRYVALFIWIFIPIIFFSIAKTKMQGYILFVSPALFLITADLFYELKDKIIKELKNKTVIIVTWLLLAAIIILPIRYCFERTGFGFKTITAPDYHISYKSLQNKIPNKTIVLNVAEPIEFMFYNTCIAYIHSIISEHEMKQIKAKGYSILYYDPKSNTVSASK